MHTTLIHYLHDILRDRNYNTGGLSMGLASYYYCIIIIIIIIIVCLLRVPVDFIQWWNAIFHVIVRTNQRAITLFCTNTGANSVIALSFVRGIWLIYNSTSKVLYYTDKFFCRVYPLQSQEKIAVGTVYCNSTVRVLLHSLIDFWLCDKMFCLGWSTKMKCWNQMTNKFS